MLFFGYQVVEILMTPAQCQVLASFCSGQARKASAAGDSKAAQDWLDALVEFKNAAMAA